jgi:MFS family permease
MKLSNRAMAFPSIKLAYPWMIVCCGMLFYCLNYFLRSSPSVLQNDLLTTFHITATQFGILAATYSFSYVPMQVPAGMIYDRFGVRYVFFLASLVATAGLCIFIYTNNLYMAGTGRFLIGLGCAFSYIGTLKLASIWLPVNRFATAAGVTTAVGMSFGIFSKKYLNHTIGTMDYRTALAPAIIAGVLLSILIFIFIREKNKDPNFTQEEPMEMKQIMHALWIISRNPQMWLIGIIGCLLYLPASFLDTYDIQFWQTVYNLEPQQAVNVSSLTFFGWIIGGPIIGAFSDRIRRRRAPLLFSGLVASVLLCVLFYFPNLINVHLLYIISFVIGFCLGSHPLCFPLGKENNPLRISGTATAVTNMLIMTGGMILPPVVGKLLDYHATQVGPNGLPIYNASDYTFALSIIPIGVMIGIGLCFFLKETYCKQRIDDLEDTRTPVPVEAIQKSA